MYVKCGPAPRGGSVPLDPAVEALLTQMASSGFRPLNELPVEEGRQLGQLLATLDGDPEPVAEVRDVAFPGPGGDLTARMYRSTEAAPRAPVVAWFHAGGGVIGDLETADRS